MQQQNNLQESQLTQKNLEILNRKHSPSKDMLYAKIFPDFVPSSPQMRQRGNVNSFVAPQHPTSVQEHHFTPQSLFCFALDGLDNSRDQQANKSRVPGTLKLQKLVSRDDAGVLLSTPTRRKDSYFFNTSNLKKVNETSQTPTNKHSKQVSQW